MKTQTEELGTGRMNTIDCGNGLMIHVYDTCDALSDQVIFVERAKKAVALELPCFKNTIEAVSEWIAKNGIELEAKLVAYHCAGSTFYPDVKVLMTESAVAYNDHGQGKHLVDSFAGAFGESFDSSMPKNVEIIGAGKHEIAGIEFDIVPNSEAYSVEIPGANAVYIHMLGHDCHSIIAGGEHADAFIDELEGYLARGFRLFLSSHHVPETVDDVKAKISYLNNLKIIAGSCSNADEFRDAVNKAYPGYSGANYLDMTAKMFFPQ